MKKVVDQFNYKDEIENGFLGIETGSHGSRSYLMCNKSKVNQEVVNKNAIELKIITDMFFIKTFDLQLNCYL